MMNNKTIVEGKVVESYPIFLTPLARSYEVTEFFTTNSILDSYDLLIEDLISQEAYRKSGDNTITRTKIPTSKGLKSFITKVEEDRFLIPFTLYGLPGDIDSFAIKVLSWINESWQLKEGNELHPKLAALTLENSTVAFTPPPIKEFGNNINASLVLALFNVLNENKVFDTPEVIREKTINLIVETTKFRAGDISNLNLKEKLEGLEQYFTVLPLNSRAAMRSIAPEVSKWNYISLAGVTGTLATASVFTTPAIALTAIVSTGIFWAGTGIYTAVRKNSQRTLVVFTKEAKLLHSQLLSWQRFKNQVGSEAKYGSGITIEPVKRLFRK